jgi:hypothetical protein
MAQPGEIDSVGTRAYELSVESDRAADGGNVLLAQQLMREAADLDGRYSVRALFVGKSDGRRVRVSPTLRRLVIAPLVDAGFRCGERDSWSPGVFLERRVGEVRHSLLPGIDKFGGAIGMLACREAAGRVTYFDWKQSKLRSGRICYRTQAELEAACARWNEILRAVVFPWWDAA